MFFRGILNFLSKRIGIHLFFFLDPEEKNPDPQPCKINIGLFQSAIYGDVDTLPTMVMYSIYRDYVYGSCVADKLAASPAIQ